jgi:TonB-linked SusC/RagA family outer membrane protein
MKRIKSFRPLGYYVRMNLLLLLSLVFGKEMNAMPRHADDVLNKKISLNVEQQEIRSILSEISKLAEIKFVYSAQRIPCRKKVSLQAQDERLGDVLNSLLAPLDVLYYVSGNQIVLTKKTEDETFLIGLKSISEDKKEIAPVSFYKTVTGKITNDKGDPLEGVSIAVKGTTRGTTTNSVGVFSIEAEVGETLEISMIGYQPYSLQIGTSNSVAVQLSPLIASINEVVVVGYGTQKRASVTGAVSSVPGKTLNELPVVSIPQALQGRVPGVQVTNNGSPGTQPIVRIRGISSISFASDPLYVVDGFPTGDLSAIDMRDVESVDVLKDASAAAIYGSRATSGIIMITTKKGRRDEKLHISLDTYLGSEQVTERLNLLNTDQYLLYERALNGAAGIAKPGRLESTNFNQPIYNGTSQTYAQTNTDWQDAYFQKGLITQTSLGLSGGNAVSRFYASAGFFSQDGTSPAVSFKRYNFRLNSDHQISKVFTFGENLYTAFTDQGYDKNEQGARTNLVNVIRQLPYMPVYDPTTSSGYRSANNSFDGSDPTNPLLDAELRNHGTRTTVKVLGTAYLEINFAKSLKFRSTFGIDYSNGLDYSFSPIFESGGTVAGSSATVATITNNRSLSTVKLFTEQLTYDKSFGNHHINAIAVYEQQEQTVKFENASGNQSSNDIQVLLNASNAAVSTQKDGNYISSFIGRLNYEFRGKYLLSVAARRDGLSVWAPEKKWATFPSGSIGWRLEQEDFMKGFKNLSELKLRAGYGITGLNGLVLGNHPWQVNVDANSAIYPFNNTNAGSATTFGSSINALGNKELEWETTKQFNIGMDAGFFNNKLTFSAEYFVRNTDNLILNVPIPPSFGFTNTSVPINIAEMENNGFELQAGYNERGKEFNWNITGNLSVIKNNVKSLAPSVPSIESGANQDFGSYNITRTEPGHPIQSFYGWIVDGIFQSAADVTNSPFQTSGTKAGDLKFMDINKDNKIDEKDRVFLGSYLPKFTYSLNFGGSYKNFDLSLFFQGVQGNKIFNASRIISEGMVRLFGSSTEVLNAWSSSNTNTNVPRAVSGDPNQNARPSPRWLEDGSFLRLKNLMLGYNVPFKGLQSVTKGAITNFRVYVSAQNVFTVTNYKGYDPEVGNRTPGTSLTNGIDYAVYPQPHSYLIGIQVNF